MAFHRDKDAKENNQLTSPSPAMFGSPSPLASKVGTFVPKSTNPVAKAPTDTPHGFGHDFKSARYEKTHGELEDIMQDDSLIPPPIMFGIKRWLESV